MVVKLPPGPVPLNFNFVLCENLYLSKVISKSNRMTSEDLVSKINNALQLFEDDLVNESELIDLQSEIKNFILNQPIAGKELGKYFSLIQRAVKSKGELLEWNAKPLLNGKISIGHKPGSKISYKVLKNVGVNTVVTLLNLNEGADLIGAAAKKEGLEWIWFPFSASNPPQGKELDKVNQLFGQLMFVLEAGHQIYIHCSAGIHRTGMVTYGFLRYLGKDRPTALQFLSDVRKVTFEQVGEERLIWGDEFENGCNNRNTLSGK